MKTKTTLSVKGYTKKDGSSGATLIGSVELTNPIPKGKKIGVSIKCDDAGQPVVYTSQKGENFVYATFFVADATPKKSWGKM